MHFSELINRLYQVPLSASRSGALYNAYSYPTKISPEAIALFIACHTDPGQSILDPFAGSGTTGLAAKLCDSPTEEMIKNAEALGLEPKWGPRNAVLYELSSSAALAASIMCNPPNGQEFEKIARRFLRDVTEELGNPYEILDNDGNVGTIRYIVWSEILVCPSCCKEVTFWESCVTERPPKISESFLCSHCGHESAANLVERATDTIYDAVLNQQVTQKKRIPVKVYGRTSKATWSRPVDKLSASLLLEKIRTCHYEGPIHEIRWGVLYRRGYHTGITHLHHFYTTRNAHVFSVLWNRISNYPIEFQKSLRLLLLSYNSSHSTLMTRIVSKSNQNDFVITGSQSGVLYISGLPIEKNIIDGIGRKIKTFSKAFDLVSTSQSRVSVVNKSSTHLDLADGQIDYVFTDPPFGDYIPYSELNQINEAWLGQITDNKNEVIINTSQNKSPAAYGLLMGEVMKEVSRVMKANGALTLVFHSAKAIIWQCLIDAYRSAGLQVVNSTVLDKLQTSFKQGGANVSVKGDPMLLLTKNLATTDLDNQSVNFKNDNELIVALVNQAKVLPTLGKELSRERLYSRYINLCLTSGWNISYNASEFYKIVDFIFKKDPIHNP